MKGSTLTILFEKYPFILEGCYLAAWVDTQNGKQKLVMQYYKNDILILEDHVECIHPVVYLNPENEIDSTELMDVQLDPFDKFNQLKSWVHGIVELGDNAFRVQDEIERVGNLQYPLSSRLLMFLARIDLEYMHVYLSKINQECMFEGKRHEPSFIASLQGILQMLVYASEERLHEFRPSYSIDHAKILSLIFKLHPPARLFTESFEYISFLEHPDAILIEDFNQLFNHPDPAVRVAIAKNPNAPQFKEYKRFLSPYLEKDPIIRKIASDMIEQINQKNK